MTSKTLLLDENPLVIQPSLAAAIGLNAAIVLQQVHYWLNLSKHVIEGRKWIYNTMNDWSKQFPFWDVKTISRAMKKLISDGIVLTGNFNEHNFDKTTWYSIDYEVLSDRIKQYFDAADQADSPSGQNVPIEKANVPLRYGQNDLTIPPNCPNDMDNLGGPIPETTTENKYIYNINQSFNHSGDKVKDGLIEKCSDTGHKEKLAELLESCKLGEVCSDMPELVNSVKMAIQNLYFNKNFAEANLKTPLELVRENLKALSSDVIGLAIANMQRAAAFGVTISSPVKYLQSCIYNAISEYNASLLSDQLLAQHALARAYPEASSAADITPKQLEAKAEDCILDDVKGTSLEKPIKAMAEHMTPVSYNQFIMPLRVRDLSDKKLALSAADEFSAGIIEARYKDILLDQLRPCGIEEVVLIAGDAGLG